MPLPSSGPLSFSAIRAEVIPGGTNSNVSLRTLSSTAGFSTPDAVSEFYGYSNITYTQQFGYYNNPCGSQITIYLGSNGLYYANTSGTLYNGTIYNNPVEVGFDLWQWNKYLVSNGVLSNNGLEYSSCGPY